MAKRMVVTLVDDVDGTEAVETVIYGIDGIAYAIDLNAVNAQELRGTRWHRTCPSAAVWEPCRRSRLGGAVTSELAPQASRAAVAVLGAKRRSSATPGTRPLGGSTCSCLGVLRGSDHGNHCGTTTYPLVDQADSWLAEAVDELARCHGAARAAPPPSTRSILDRRLGHEAIGANLGRPEALEHRGRAAPVPQFTTPPRGARRAQVAGTGPSVSWGGPTRAC